MQDLSFSVWLNSFSIMPSGSTYDVTPSFLWLNNIPEDLRSEAWCGVGGCETERERERKLVKHCLVVSWKHPHLRIKGYQTQGENLSPSLAGPVSHPYSWPSSPASPHKVQGVFSQEPLYQEQDTWAWRSQTWSIRACIPPGTGAWACTGEEVKPPGCRFPDNKGPPALPRALLRLHLWHSPIQGSP